LDQSIFTAWFCVRKVPGPARYPPFSRRSCASDFFCPRLDGAARYLAGSSFHCFQTIDPEVTAEAFLQIVEAPFRFGEKENE